MGQLQIDKKWRASKEGKNPEFQMVCTFDGDGPLVSFMHATNDTSRRSNGSRQGRNEKKRSRWKENPIRKWCAFGFVTLRNKTVFLYSGSSMVLAKTSNVLVNDKQKLKKEKKRSVFFVIALV